MWSNRLRLKVIEGSFKGRNYPLDSPDLNVGRAAMDGTRAPGWLLLEDATVSRVQAYLRWNGMSDAYTLVNSSETNPTQVNDQVVTGEVDLKVGDQIRMGNCVLELQEVDARFGAPSVSPTGRNIGHLRALAKAAPPPAIAGKKLNVPVAKPDAPSAPAVSLGAPAAPKKPVNLKTQARLMALVNMPDFLIEVVDGPDRGQRYNVSGLNLAIGGPLGDQVNVEKAKKWFDQDIPLDDPKIPTRYLGLSWNAPLGGFDLWRPQGGDLLVSIERTTGGMTWKAQLPLEQAGLVLPLDVIKVGRSHLQILQKPEPAKLKESILEAKPQFSGPQGALGVRRPPKIGPKP